MINRAARIHFGMIFGPSVRKIYAHHADDLTSYARNFVAESDEVAKEDFVTGLGLEGANLCAARAVAGGLRCAGLPDLRGPGPGRGVRPGPASGGERPADHRLAGCAHDHPVQYRQPLPRDQRAPRPLPRWRAHRHVGVGKTYDDITAFGSAAAPEERIPWLDAPERRPGCKWRPRVAPGPTPAAGGLMSGAPPFGMESQVTLANWQDPPFNRWAFQHVRELIPTARIPRGDAPPWRLETDEAGIAAIRFRSGGRELRASRTCWRRRSPTASWSSTGA